jgi:FixJ family two-component response regulator
MSQILSDAVRRGGLGRRITKAAPAPSGRLVSTAHGRWDDRSQRRQQGLRAGSARASAAPQATPTVFIVDDDVLVRESLGSLISSAGWRAVTFASAREFLAHPRVPGPSCLALEMSLPDINGLELQERVAADHVETPIIFITGYADIGMTVRAMKAGAFEFLTKPFDNEALLGVLRSAIERSRAALKQKAEIQALRDDYTSLTTREREVMALVVSGLLNKQVGFELGISEITVKAHRGRMMQKMKADSLANLVKTAERLRLATTPSSSPMDFTP